MKEIVFGFILVFSVPCVIWGCTFPVFGGSPVVGFILLFVGINGLLQYHAFVMRRIRESSWKM